MFISREAIFRKTPELKSEVLDILKVNTEVEIINEVKNDKENECFCEVEVNRLKGYIIKSSLSDKKVEKIFGNNISEVSKESKTRMINEAVRILNQKTTYSAKLDYKFFDSGKTRLNGYFNIPYYEDDSEEEYFSYDCSTFCDTILNRVFKENMVREGNYKIEVKKEIFKPNIWATRDYFSNAFLEKDDNNKKFDVIQFIENKGEILSVESMQIGDFIIGIIDKENEKHNSKLTMNHIMMYMGDEYFAHASYTNGKEIFNKVLLTKIVDNFYIKIGFENRFDKSILLARYKERSVR